MKLIVWVLSCLVVRVISHETANSVLRCELKNIFGYDFQRFPKLGEVLFWNITPDKQAYTLENCGRRFTEFESDKTYLIFIQIVADNFNVYFWAGETSPLDNRKVLAKYALILFSKLVMYFGQPRDKYLYLSRENENFESLSFKHVMKILQGVEVEVHSKFNFHHLYIHGQFPMRYLNLYLMREWMGTSRIKQVSVNPHWLKDDACLVLEMGYNESDLPPVDYYCGNQTSNKIQSRAYSLTRSLLSHYKAKDPPMKFDPSNYKKFQEFLKKNSGFHEIYEFDHSDDYSKDAKTFIDDYEHSTSLFKYSSSTIEEIKSRPIQSNSFKDDNACYLFDSKTASGSFIIFGVSTNYDTELQAIEHAETYLQGRYPHGSRMRIMLSNHTSFLTEFELNLRDHPRYPYMKYDTW